MLQFLGGFKGRNGASILLNVRDVFRTPLVISWHAYGAVLPLLPDVLSLRCAYQDSKLNGRAATVMVLSDKTMRASNSVGAASGRACLVIKSRKHA